MKATILPRLITSSVIQTMNPIPVQLVMTFEIIYLFTTVHIITAITTIMTIYLTTKLLSKTNINNFINKTSKEKWTPIYDQNNPDNAYENFLKIFVIHYNYCFPFLRKSPKSNIPKKDWCTFDIAKSCKTKCKLYKTFTQNSNDINKQNYITFRNKLNHTIRKAKQTYYYNISKDCDIKKHGLV